MFLDVLLRAHTGEIGEYRHPAILPREAEMVLSVEKSGGLEIASYQKGREVYTLVECPFCGHEFDKNEARWKHLLEKHDPEDAGLAPLGEVRDNQNPLFKPVDELPSAEPKSSART